jgi:uncharacterized protein YjiS (DUF1127 family)
MQTIIGNIARWLDRRAKIIKTVRELESLNDRELSDIGIHRSMIYRIARDTNV